MGKQICILLMILALLLSGCQLAKPETQEETGKDMLVGVFMTEEHLDLFDFDAYLQDNLGALSGGTLSPEDTARYSGRIWAEGDAATGRYVFKDLEGIFFSSYRVVTNGEYENAYWSSVAGDGICDVSIGHHSLDEGFRLDLSGTVYFSDTHPDPSLYFNPVYQTPDGQVYLVSGQGMAFGGGLGGSANQTMTEEGTRRENGESQSWSSRISVTMETVSPARSLVILQMDEDNGILSRQELDPGADMEDLKPDTRCAYLLVEEHTAQGIRRSLYQKEDLSLYFYRELENRLCLKARISISWPE